ncbi:tRNA lysidine(34) synthetase TilS [Candidatus Marinamargulisbacteria bacterium SCGC AG-410-N11]|nr:tRNA lysidine(34) synthetase TilS [Candidatus Marinamargulisbacteria bacterium SCGC AG-410-N11]
MIETMFNQEHKLIKTLKLNKQTIIVSCSSGSDSMAALLVVKQLISSENIIIMYFDHGLRPQESKKEVEFLNSFSNKYTIRFFKKYIPVQLYATKKKVSIETAGRQLRRQWLAHKAKLYNSEIVVMGHHQDDSCETMLFRLLRGVQSKMVPLKEWSPLNKSVKIWRPLINQTKQDILQFLEQNNQGFCVDSSNESLEFNRNKLRHFLTDMAPQINPNYQQSIIRFGQHYQQIQDYLNSQISHLLNHVIVNDRQIKFDKKIVNSQPPILKKQLLYNILNLWANQHESIIQFSDQHIDSIIDLISKKQTGKKLSLPAGLQVSLNYNDVILSKASNHKALHYQYEIVNLDREVTIKELNIKVMISLIDAPVSNVKSTADTAFLNGDLYCNQPIIVRNKRPGDQFYSFGMNHPRKLKDYFIKQKIPFEKRQNLPLFLMNNHIIWVTGESISDQFKVSTSTKKILRIKLIKQEE